MLDKYYKIAQFEGNSSLLHQIESLYGVNDINFVSSKEEMMEKYSDILKHESNSCDRPCKNTFSTCFIKEAPLNLVAVSDGINPVADFSDLHCVIEPCVTKATIDIYGCKSKHVKTKVNAVHIVGKFGYWFNFEEVFLNKCERKFDFRRAAGQGTGFVDQVLCYIPEYDHGCPVDLCDSKIDVDFKKAIICDDKLYLVYDIKVKFPKCC
ncbi:hypothetical protein CSE16_11415 [Solibacillus sp. R5-41]|uniref:hypothetical protein n=1 Tax=Solibacillus sp. R5-41 TaxID=2048654 RepID=UPI000C128BE8|nr:hypothetical protein [Solibacillus sp. R5-41]ATP40609.1 hypothetical protein CSE16_11415 [Solibacillus sp. R5-41]